MYLLGLAGVAFNMQGQQLLLQKLAVAARWSGGVEGCSGSNDRKRVVLGQV